MNKKLCLFLDIIYFVITFFVVYWLFTSFNSLAVSSVGFPILKDMYFLTFQVQEMLIISFSMLLSFLLDFSFISKILTHFKFSKRTQLVVLIVLVIAVVIFGIILYNFKCFVPFA